MEKKMRTTIQGLGFRVESPVSRYNMGYIRTIIRISPSFLASQRPVVCGQRGFRPGG